MKEVKAIVRKERVDRVVHALLEAGLSRIYVSHVHVLGAGVDPANSHISLEELDVYTEKAKIEVFCEAEELATTIDAVRTHGATGHRGDGVIVVTDLDRIVSVRTGDEGAVALL
ncbi:MAG: P-II family nitrogen regulator [Gemmatimonadetes bacterium]|nr:P-II family nitrogen regulator [Gemmatimonadota bacterium]